MAVSETTRPGGQRLTGVPGVRARLGSLKRPAAGQEVVTALQDEVAVLRDQMTSLKAELNDNRALHRRLAELTDVVTELCIPLAERDETRVAEVLDRYRDSL